MKEAICQPTRPEADTDGAVAVSSTRAKALRRRLPAKAERLELPDIKATVNLARRVWRDRAP